MMVTILKIEQSLFFAIETAGITNHRCPRVSPAGCVTALDKSAVASYKSAHFIPQASGCVTAQDNSAVT